jgi:hypothetical protein
MLDMRVIFADVPAGLWDLPSVEMEVTHGCDQSVSDSFDRLVW